MPDHADTLPLSVAIVCKDSARTIARTLASVAGWASEIVAVDSGSTDQTLSLLAGHDATVVQSEWLGHVKTKQRALESCTRPWVFCLDSDESPDEELKRRIAALVRADPGDTAGARVNRKVWYRGRFLDHAWQPERRLRLVRRDRAAWSGVDPHDRLEVRPGGGRVVDLPGTLRHDSFATFAEQYRKDVAYAEMMAANLHASGARGSRARLVLSPVGAFVKQMVLKQAWRDGPAGWLAAMATASATLHKHAVLLELDRLDAGDLGPDR